MSAIRELQEMLRAEEKRSHDLAACLADMGRVNGRLREENKDALRVIAALVMRAGGRVTVDALSVDPRTVVQTYHSATGLEITAFAPPSPSPASQEPTP